VKLVPLDAEDFMALLMVGNFTAEAFPDSVVVVLLHVEPACLI